MIQLRHVLVVLLAIVATYAAMALLANLTATPRSGPLPIRRAENLARAGEQISLVTWNLGYAALGADMDFATDGGTRYFPRSREVVLSNLRGIVETLNGIDADVFLLQEVARASPLNLGVDVLEGVAARFKGFATVFEPEIATRMLPPPLRVAHGTALMSRVAVSSAEKRLITLENERLSGLLLREYRMLIARLPVSNSSRQWVVINVHLAAFDRAAAVRSRQLADVIQFAEQEFAKGNAVVVGGDWNLEFERGRFPHSTAPEHLFWLHDFPTGDLPRGWRAVFDPSVPSARTVHKPYVAGENYVTVIDGYIVSPNVAVEEVKGIDRAFLNSDHQPVFARFRLR